MDKMNKSQIVRVRNQDPRGEEFAEETLSRSLAKEMKPIFNDGQYHVIKIDTVKTQIDYHYTEYEIKVEHTVARRQPVMFYAPEITAQAIPDKTVKGKIVKWCLRKLGYE